MIRRTDGNDWLLISQIDHAHLAGELASVWGGAAASLPDSAELLPAIRGHDDGWLEWEAAPTIDPESGAPRDFTEMPMDVATGIWNRSIERCGGTSPWAGLWVGRHFQYLAERSEESREPGSEERRRLKSFLEREERRRLEWRRQLRRHVETAELNRREETGYRFVQFFDRISLWICCAKRTARLMLQTPADETVAFTPQGDGGFEFATPAISVPSLTVSLQARRIPASRLGSDEELRDALGRATVETLEFVIRGL